LEEARETLKSSAKRRQVRGKVKVLEHGDVHVVRARRGVSEVSMDSGTEFEWADRKVVGERSVFRIEGDRVGFGLGFKVEEMAIII